ncbi:hypothetical protein H9P43_007308 [Blastocladiella emersonii ATCC 22665]|nr:hypothetical protein H9P43_007308 [Blastocladiella emersonii ATCC 22665]
MTVSIRVVPPPPAPAPIVVPAPRHLDATLLDSLNDPAVCDVAFLACDSTSPIHASRAILKSRSPFFAAMFRGNWAESIKSSEPIKLPEWGRVTLVVVLLHLYSGWSPAGSKAAVPAEIATVLARLEVKTTDLGSLAELTNCFEIAGMLECCDLVKSLRDNVVVVLDDQVKALKM